MSNDAATRQERHTERRLLVSLFCTYLGAATTATAVTIFLVQEFGVGLSTGVALVLQLIPNLLLGPIAGEIVARTRPQWAATAGSLAAGLAVLGYLLVQEVWQPQVLSLLVGLAGVIGIPARMALRAAVLRPERLKRSTGAIVAAERLGLVLGPLVASALTAALRVEYAFLLEFALALVACAALLGIRGRPPGKPAPRGGGLSGVYARAWQLMRADSVVWEYSLTGFTYSVGAGIRRLLLPAALVVSLSSSEGSLGYLVGAIALGGIVGGTIAPYLAERNVDRAYLVQSGIEVLLWVSLAFIGNLWAYATVLFVAGVFEASTTTLYFIRVQERLDPSQVGRYFSLMSPLTDASIAGGVLLASGFGAALLTDYGAWAIALLIGIPFIICPTILRGAVGARRKSEATT